MEAIQSNFVFQHGTSIRLKEASMPKSASQNVRALDMAASMEMHSFSNCYLDKRAQSHISPYRRFYKLKSNTNKGMETEKQSHFVLVHGACHGAWCWYKVATILKSAGHRVTALDLTACGINPKQVHQVKSISDYFEPLMEFMESLPSQEKVILVAHSYGGLGISFAMEKFPHKITAAVFATATMPGPELTYTTVREEFYRRIDFTDSEFKFGDGPNNPPTSRVFGPNIMSTMLYQLSPPEDLVLAMMLIRHFPLFSNDSIQIEAEFTKEKYGSVRRIFIVCAEDNISKAGLQNWLIKNNPPDEVKIISDADHMVMFSKPQELCSCLQDIANKYF